MTLKSKRHLGIESSYMGKIILLIVVTSVIVIGSALFVQNAKGDIAIIADPDVGTADNYAIMAQCAVCYSSDDKYGCTTSYVVKDAQGNEQVKSCGDFIAAMEERQSTGGGSSSGQTIYLSGSEDFMPCGTMTVRIKDTSITQLSDLRIKFFKNLDPTTVLNLIKVDDLGAETQLTPVDDYNILCSSSDICSVKNTDSQIIVKFKIPCLDGTTSYIEPYKDYSFIIEANSELVAEATNIRQFRCNKMLSFPDKKTYRPDGLNSGQEGTLVSFSKEIKKTPGTPMEMTATIKPGCFDGTGYERPCIPDISPIATAAGYDEDTNRLYTFDMPHLKDTNDIKAKYAEETMIQFQITVDNVPICDAWKTFKWNCPKYLCYEDTFDSDKKKILSSPVYSDGDGKPYPGCEYQKEVECEEGCYAIGTDEIGDPSANNPDECAPPNSWRYGCYDADYELNRNPSRCLISDLNLDHMKFCKQKTISDPAECYHIPFTEEDRDGDLANGEASNVLTINDLWDYIRVIAVVTIRNEGTSPIYIRNDNIKATFNEAVPTDIYFKDISNNLHQAFELEPGCPVEVEIYFDMPPQQTEPVEYELIMAIDNLDYDSIPVGYDRTEDNDLIEVIRLNYDCCKDCTCPIDYAPVYGTDKNQCNTCYGVCSRELNRETGEYECRSISR